MRQGVKRQHGYFLVLAIILIMVIGLMGSVMVHLFTNRATISAAQMNGLKTFYLAESGLEIGSRLLTHPALTSRVSCAAMTGTGVVTNASLSGGTFTVSAVGSAPVFATSTLNGAITASATTITLVSTAGFASSGRVLVDFESVDYQGVSGNSLIGVTRGAGGTLASVHANGTGVGQYQCTIDSQGGIPSIASPTYQREIQRAVQLQDGWAVSNRQGSNYIITRWNYPTEGQWTNYNFSNASATNLNGVSMLSYVDGWAVGDLVSNQLAFLRWNGSSWSTAFLSGGCGGQHLYGIVMVEANEGWAVGARYRNNCGNSGPRRYTVLKWNGSVWSLLTPTSSPSIPADANGNQDLNAVHVIDTTGAGAGNVGFAVGASGTILRYNGTNWISQSSPTGQVLNGVWVVSTSEAWAVGAGGVILKWNGTSWSTQTSPVSSVLNGVAMLDTDGDGLANVGWAVGDSGVILTYNGSSWSLQLDIGGTNLSAITIVNQNDAWLVGANGVVRHWDGSAWTDQTSDVSKTLNSISFIPSLSNSASNWRQVFG